MAAGADGAALNEIGDASVMLSRLVGTLQVDSKSAPVGIGAQLSRPQTIREQVELAAIHGHHIPGTGFTTRHGWIPLIGPQLNDTSAAVAAHLEQVRKANSASETIAQARAAAMKRGDSPRLVAKRFATVPSAQDRKLTPAQQEMVRQHAAKIAQAQRAAEAAASPAMPRGPGGHPTTRDEAVKDTVGRYEVPAAPEHPSTPAGIASQLIRARAAARQFPPAGVVPRAGGEPSQPNSAKEAADVFAAIAPPPPTATPTPAHQAAVAAGQAMKVEPGTVGEHLQKTDPALLSLAAPGASQAALKAYVDARVAAEVARQVGQITQQQHDEVERQLDALHRSQQRTISFLRRQAVGINNESDREDRIHLVMYSLFTTAGVGLAIAGIVTGIAPIAAAIVAAAAPLAQIIHDYVRGD